MKRFIIESITDSNYLNTNPHPKYRLVQIIAGKSPVPFSNQKQKDLFIWELIEIRMKRWP